MRMAYLGLFSKIFTWVFDKILGPIVKFIAGLFSSVFEWVFNTILQPILIIVFKTVLPWVLEIIQELLCGIFYSILASLCKVLDYFQEIFNIFAGSQPVQTTIGGQTQSVPLIDAIFFLPDVNRFFVVISILSVGLIFTFAIIAVIRSTLDIDFEGKRPVSAVLRSMFKAITNLLLVGLITLFILNLSGLILSAINEGARANETTLGRVVFCVSTLNASKIDGDNISGGSSKDMIEDTARKYYYYKGIPGAKNYDNEDTVKGDFKLNKLDFITAGIVCIFLVIVLFTACITFIQRIFDVIILYIVSPLFISTMPLDDGEKFKKWKELFIGKVFGGYGTVLAMNMFLLMVPVIMGNKITWGDNTSAEGAYIFKLLFLCGGAYALTKVGPMITTLLNWQSGQAESATAGLVGGFVGGKVMAAGMAVGQGVVGGLAKGAGAAGKKFAGNRAEKKKIADQKWKSMQENGLKDGDKLGDGAGVSAEDDTYSSDEYYGMSQARDTKEDKMQDRADAEKEKQEADGLTQSVKDYIDSKTGGAGKDGDGKDSGNKAELGADKEAGKDGDKAEAGDDKKDLKAEGAENKDGDNAAKLDAKKDGKDGDKPEDKKDDRYWLTKKMDGLFNFMHRTLPHKADKNGNYSFGFLGFRAYYNKDGKRTGWKIPGVSWRKDAKGGVHWDGLHIAGIGTWKKGASGKMRLTDFPMIGYKGYEDKDGKKHTLSKFGNHYEKGKDGKMHKTSGLFASYSAAPDGTYTRSSLFGVKFGRTYDADKRQYVSSGFRIGNMVFGGQNPDSSASTVKKDSNKKQ